MKRLAFRLLQFSLPGVILLTLYFLCYSPNAGDLARIGYLSAEKNYVSQFRMITPDSLYIKEIDQNIQDSVPIYVIGDSFSAPNKFSYHNILAAEFGYPIFAYSTTPGTDDPFERLLGLLDMGYFENAPRGTVILQTVERELFSRTESMNSLLIDTLRKKAVISFEKKKRADNAIPIWETIPNFPKFYWNGLLQLFDDDAFGMSDVYKIRLKDSLFTSKKPRTLWVYNADILWRQEDNNEKIQMVDSLFSYFFQRLKVSGQDLIVLVAPDKFSAYYDMIIDKKNYPAANVLASLAAIPKRYGYLDADSMLRAVINGGSKDIYFGYDTHWSPKGHTLVAKELHQLIISRRIITSNQEYR